METTMTNAGNGAGAAPENYTTQMDAARKGIATPQMRTVAEKEHMPLEQLMGLVAEGKVAIPANKHHACLDAEGIGSMLRTLPYFSSVHVTLSLYPGVFPPGRLLRLCAALHSAPVLPTCVPTVLSCCSTGISTCCPSATPLGLALGPDLPRADQLYPGNLGYSAGRIPTFLSLLIPAFSLPCSPQPLPVLLPPACNAPLPMTFIIPRLRRRVSAPDIFGAGPLGQ